MTTISANTAPHRRTHVHLPAIAIAGVEWPVFKLQAVGVGALAALACGVASGSASGAAWTLSVVTTLAWWHLRALHSRPGFSTPTPVRT